MERPLNLERLSPTHTRTIRALLDGYASLSAKKLIEPLSSDFIHHVLPTSLGMPSRTREEFALCAAGIFSIFEEFRMIPTRIYEDEQRDVVVIHAKMKGTPRNRRKDGRMNWENECLLMVHLSKDGKQVVKLEEFVDSAKAVEMRRNHGYKFSLMAADSREALIRNAIMTTCLAAGTIMSAMWLWNWYD
ncbi:hypothetical protein QBC42DRAFT_281868 [Cladorrhinum samala]|uniref:SnoaL-like domain-containing protein n=1 Tax=Cladorrhinum samala TaxID=585594 RepID=A0AAV9I7G5_9PEZI|nr:hypothetical protein QBC42DRAFT_281868 [Cladorrhinum samala]